MDMGREPYSIGRAGGAIYSLSDKRNRYEDSDRQGRGSLCRDIGKSYGVRVFFVLTVCPLFLWFVFIEVCQAENGVSIGYGFGAWNGNGIGHIEQKKSYDYGTGSYFYEKPLTSALAFMIEPFVGSVSRPVAGADVGFSMYIKAYLPKLSPENRFYFTAGPRAAYTSVKFMEQGTHGLFVLQGGVGYRRGRLFIENRFHHYSNGGLATPNRSVNSNLVVIGCYF